MIAGIVIIGIIAIGTAILVIKVIKEERDEFSRNDK